MFAEISMGPKEPRPPHPGIVAPADEPAGDAARPSRLLVVEDEWFISMEIESILAGAGYVVVGVAATRGEAVALAEMHRPDLVVMDIRLRNDDDGVETASEVLRRVGARSIFVSANYDAGTRERADAAEPLGWVVKPFSDRQLLSAVANALKELRGGGSD